MIGKLLLKVGGRVSHGLVLAWLELFVLRLVFLDTSLQSPGQEKKYLIYPSPHRSSQGTVVCTNIVEEIMADLHVA